MRFRTPKYTIEKLQWMKFWRLTPIREWERVWKYLDKKSWSFVSHRTIECKCDCWNIITSQLPSILSGLTKSCWCLIKEVNWTHWMTNEKIYKVFASIKTRCDNKQFHSYKDYGWRWINCEWETFEDFYSDMWKNYKEWLSIDRIDVNWNYCKENCKWSTDSGQQQNRRDSIILTHNWKTQHINKWAEELWFKSCTLKTRFYSWATVEKILTTPIWKHKKQRTYKTIFIK